MINVRSQGQSIFDLSLVESLSRKLDHQITTGELHLQIEDLMALQSFLYQWKNVHHELVRGRLRIRKMRKLFGLHPSQKNTEQLPHHNTEFGKRLKSGYVAFSQRSEP